MSLKRNFFSAITLAFALGAFSTFVAAQDSNPNKDQNSTQKQRKFERREGFRKGNGQGMRGGGVLRGLRGIDLTDAQKEQIRTIMESKRNSFQGNREEMRNLMQAKRDGSITAEQQEKLKAMRDQMRADAKQIEEQVLAILTPEQRTQLEQRKEEMRKLREERRQMRRQNRQTPQTENQDN
jgi:periplasmic protein CpxP/Spy